MRAITVNRSPRRFAGIIEALIRVAFTDDFLRGYDEENGVDMFCKMNLKFMVLSNFEKVKLLRTVINPSIVGLDNAAFKKTITLLCDHFPGLQNVAPYLSLLKVENTDVARYLRTNQLAGNSMDVVQKMESLTINDIFRDIRELKDEGMIQTIESNSNDTEFDEANIIMSKVKCYNCGKMGHFSKNCQKPRKFKKFERVQLVECPDNYEVTFDKMDQEDEVNLVDHTSLQFVLDSGATAHVVTEKKHLHDIIPTNIVIKGINGDDVCKEEGTLTIGNLTLLNVKVMPNSPRNIISLPKLCESGFKVEIKGNHLKILKECNIIAEVEKQNKLWYLKPQDVQSDMVFATIQDIKEIHENNGHCSLNQLKSLTNNSYATSELQDVLNQCEVCQSMLNKTKIKKNKDIQEIVVGEYLHADLIGPINGAYGLLVADKKSSFVVSRVLKSKAEATDQLIQCILTFEKLLLLTNKSLCFIRTDNEFKTIKFNNFCNSKGLIHEITAPHSSYQNGKAENINKQIERKMRKLLLDSNVENRYWNFAFRHAIFLHNYLTINTSDQSPWEIFRKTRKTVNIDAPFGCKIIAFNHTIKQKIFKKEVVGTFIGFQTTTKIAFILENNSNKIIRSSSFNFIRSIFPMKLQSTESNNSTESSSCISLSNNATDNLNMEKDIEMETTNLDNPITENIAKDNQAEPEAIQIEKPSQELILQPTIISTSPKHQLHISPIKSKIIKANNPKVILRSRRKHFNSTITKLKDISDNLNLLNTKHPIVEEVEDTQEPTHEDTTQKLLTNEPIQDLEETHILVSKNKYQIPKTFKDVERSLEKQKWIEAINDEITSIQSNGVYSLVPKENVNQLPITSDGYLL